MKKTIFFIFLAIFLLGIVSAIQVTPGETLRLPNITSNTSLDTRGSHRTLLYCSWRIGDQGEEAIPMSSEVCPESPQYFTFEQNETYYISIKYAEIFYNISGEWELTRWGGVDHLQVEYGLDMPEPPQSFLDSIQQTILDNVRYFICQIFPWLNFCS